MTTNPLISVVMPVNNGEKYLPQAIDSVLCQTYNNFEFIIIDDGSTDKTKEIVNRYFRIDHRIKLIIQKKSGISNAMNTGIRKAKGEYIFRADGDDVCLRDRFKIQINYLLKHPTIDVLGTYFCTFIDDNFNKCVTIPANSFDVYNAKSFIHHPTCAVKRKIFMNNGLYDSRYDNAEDFELWYRWFSQGVKFYTIPQVLYKKRIHQGSVSVSKVKNQTYLLLKVNLKAILEYHIPFTIKGYLHVLEQLLYFLYLSLHLDKIYVRNKSIHNLKNKESNE